MLIGDTETTGLLVPESANIFAQPHITEIYIQKFDEETYEVEDEFYTLLKPPMPIEPLITKITGIDDEMVMDSPSFAEIYDDLCDFCLGETGFIGHNVNFDLDVLRHELRRIGFEFQFPWFKDRICTVEISYPIKNKRLKLGQLHEMATGGKIINAHRAKADTLATFDSYKWLISEGWA